MLGVAEGLGLAGVLEAVGEGRDEAAAEAVALAEAAAEAGVSCFCGRLSVLCKEPPQADKTSADEARTAKKPPREETGLTRDMGYS